MQDDLVIAEIEPNDKSGAIRKFSRLLKATGRIEHEDEFVRELMQRKSRPAVQVWEAGWWPFLTPNCIFFLKWLLYTVKRAEALTSRHLTKNPQKFFLLISDIINPENILESLGVYLGYSRILFYVKV